MSLPPFVVLDTNVVLDWLIYQDRRVAPLVAALASGAMRLASDDVCLAELRDVLSRERIRATPEQRACAVQTYRSRAHMVDMMPARERSEPTQSPPPAGDLPQCRDQDDQKFIELAVRCRARALVSRDKELLRMHQRMLLVAGLAVVEPGEALAHF